MAEELVSGSFNQESSHFSVATDAGFRIFSTNPFKEILRREWNSQADEKNSNDTISDLNTFKARNAISLILDKGGFGIVEMLHKTNIVGLVGGSALPKFPTNRLVIYDDQQQLVVCEIEVDSAIKCVRLRRERIVISTSKSISVFTMSGQPQKLYSFDTRGDGLIALSSGPSLTSATLAFQGITFGQVHVVEIPLVPTHMNSTTAATQAPSASIITAHTSALAALAVSEDGALIATASEKGTLIRVFSAASGAKLSEFRRGTDQAEIYSLRFNRKHTRIVVASNKGTIHVFNLSIPVIEKPNGEDGDKGELEKSKSKKMKQPEDKKDSGNRQSNLAFIAPISTYLSSEWSFAFTRLPVETKCICSFAEEDDSHSDVAVKKESILVIGSDGSFYSFVLDGVAGGQMEMERFNWYF